MSTRQRWLALALIATLVAVFWPERENTVEFVEAARHIDNSANALTPELVAGSTSQSAVDARERVEGMRADLFPAQTWVQSLPPPKRYVPPTPQPPSPPPLPFKYLGRWVERGQQTLFLAQGDQPIAIQQGQVLLGNWRVDEITGRAVVFTYLPLNMQSILGITP